MEHLPHRELNPLAWWLRAAVLGALALLALIHLADVALLVFTAVLMAAILRHGAQVISRKTRLPVTAAVALICVTLLVVIGGFAWWGGPHLVGQLGELKTRLTVQAHAANDKLNDTQWGRMALAHMQTYIQTGEHNAAGMATGVATSTLGGVGSAVVVLATALYFCVSPTLYLAGILAILPARRRPAWDRRLRLAGDALWRWSAGQAIDMAVVGVLTGTGLMIIGVPLAVPLALLAALCNFVPYIGAIAGALPAVIVAFGQSPAAAGWTALLILCVQALEGNVIGPLIQKNAVGLPPALTILSQTVLGTLLSPAGLVLATPLTVAGLVLAQDMLAERDATESVPVANTSI